MILKANEILIVSASLDISDDEEKYLTTLLSLDEAERANRFRFPLHRKRFIAARGLLRRLISQYIQIDAAKIQFAYQDHGKPYLPGNPLQFNISHSHDIAVFAFSKSNILGIDIEKIEKQYDDAVAKRFFSDEEYAQLHALPLHLRTEGFYRIWAAKEAVIKLSGHGIGMGLQSFSVPLDIDETALLVKFAQSKDVVYVQGLDIHKDYQAALAVYQRPGKIVFSSFT